MALVLEPMETLIPNTTMVKTMYDGVHRTYRITPNEGYVLHDSAYDWDETDEETGAVIAHHLGYTSAMASCGFNYNFAESLVTASDGTVHTAYGSREFFAKLASDVPENEIFGGVNEPDHEVM